MSIKFIPEYRKTVTRALDLMIETIREALEQNEQFSRENEAEEDPVPEEYAHLVPGGMEGARAKARDGETATLGRLQRQREDVMELKAEFEAAEIPSQEVLREIKTLIENCIAYAAVGIFQRGPACFLQHVDATPRPEPFDMAALDPDQLRHASALKIYADVLWGAFDESTPMWKKAPFADFLGLKD
jgi:hypothetical protein